MVFAEADAVSRRLDVNLQAVLVLHVVKGLDAPESAYGVLFTVFAAGCLVGTWLMPKIRDRFGGRACLLVAASLGTVRNGSALADPRHGTTRMQRTRRYPRRGPRPTVGRMSGMTYAPSRR